MKEAKKLTAGINVKVNKLAILYHTIRGSINMKQDKAEPNDESKLSIDNVYDTMEVYVGKTILRSKNLTKNGSQASERELQSQI